MPKNGERERSATAVASFILGLVSMFIFQLIIIPILAAVLGVITITQFDASRQKGRWMAITGLVLGILYGLLGSVRLLGY